MAKTHTGELVKEEIEKRGMTQAFVARQLGTTRQNLSELLSRKSMDVDLLQKLSGIIGFEIVALLGGDKSIAMANESQVEYKTALAEMGAKVSLVIELPATTQVEILRHVLSSHPAFKKMLN